MLKLPLSLQACSVALVLAFAGCGGSVTSSDGGGGGTTASGGTSSGGTSSGGTGGTGGSSAECTAAAEAITSQTSGVQTCTSVVRLDYQSFEIKGYHIVCSADGATTEDAARATAQADTGFGQNATLLSGPNPTDEWVFFQSPGDFGGVGVVAARHGKTVFGGGVVWSGHGEITYPAAFEPASDLASGCANMTPEPSARGWDLEQEMALTDAEVKAALDVVWQTALPDGLQGGGYVFDAVVLLYPPTVGVLDPTTAEWIVMVNSGWLE